MSIRSLFVVATLGCALAACDEDPMMPADPGEGDAASPIGNPVGNTPDGGVRNTPDGAAVQQPGQPGQPGKDGGTTPTGDASIPSDDKQNTRFFLPTAEPTNTSAPTIKLDAQGNAHMVYPNFILGGAHYAFCPSGNCKDQDNVQVVEFETEGTVYDAMIALTNDGKPRILFSSFANLYYGECESNCGQRGSWQYEKILKHDNEKEVTGRAFTLDNQGRPRFLIHTYRALFGIGQKPAKTELAQCDSNCINPASWRYDIIAEPEIWYGSTLLIDATGRMHVATNLFDYKTENPSPDVGAYLTCSGDCTSIAAWSNAGIGFFAPYESSSEAVSIKPSVALALTKDGRPRFAQLHKNAEGVKTVSYFSCEQDCAKDNWVYAWNFTGDNVHDGLDLALDAQDHPRIVHTVNYNIAVSWCNDANCSVQGAKWNAELVEDGATIPADDIFLEWNCTIGAWFLHAPSIAIAADGKPIIGYQARDVSGGFKNPDPTKPSCVAGTDMTWSRITLRGAAY